MTLLHDNSLQGSSSSSREGRVMAVDLMGVSSQVEVSPRTHSISLSLSVHDVSLQRLQMAPSTPVSTVGREGGEGVGRNMAQGEF